MTPDQVDEDFDLGKKWIDSRLRLPEEQVARYAALATYHQELFKLAKRAQKNARAAQRKDP